MSCKVIVGFLGACGLVATLGYAVPHQGTARTVNDGVYTSDQADRGMQVVEDYGCRNCHGRQLEGGADEQPQLAGEQFVSAWAGRKLDELAEKITTMPADQPDGYHV